MVMAEDIESLQHIFNALIMCSGVPLIAETLIIACVDVFRISLS